MIKKTLLIAVVASISGCISIPDVPRVSVVGAQPRTEPAPVPAPSPAGPYSNLTERKSFATKASVKLQAGFYRGDFTVAASIITVEGAGKDQTVIEGSLIIDASQTTVKNLTVLGDVVIKGLMNKLEGVDYRGKVEDKGSSNKY
jgi:hypothetical protein